MTLVYPASTLTMEQLLALRGSLIEELKELPGALQDAPGSSEARRARGRTARGLVLDALAWVGDGLAPADRRRLIEEINLLYDVTIVAAEYYKLFVRAPTVERPAGRI